MPFPVSQVYKQRTTSYNFLFLNSSHLPLLIPTNSKIYLAILCQLALEGLSDRGLHRPSHHLMAKNQIPHLVPFGTGAGSKNWTHWTETVQSKSAEAAHNSFLAKGTQLLPHIFSHRTLSCWLLWKPMGFGSDSSFKVIFNGAHLLVIQKRTIALFFPVVFTLKKENLIDKQLF